MVKSLQRGTITIASGAASQTATVTSVATGVSTLTMLGFSTTGTSAPIGTQYPRLALTNATTITATRGGTANTTDFIISYELVEYYTPAEAAALMFAVSLGTQSYAADGSVPTLSQTLFQIWAFLAERTISGTTVTVKQLDGTTTAMTFTIDSATTPTSITRTT